MLTFFHKLPSIVKSLLIIILLSGIVIWISLTAFPDWTENQYGWLLLTVAALVGVASLPR